jgi:hypothetical protein
MTKPSERNALVGAIGLLLAVGCSRPSSSSLNNLSDGGADGAVMSTPSASASPSSAVVAADAGFEIVSAVPVEGRRAHVTRFSEEPALGPATALLEKHFAGAGKSFDVQIAELTANGRRIVLVMESGKATTTDAHPFAFVATGANNAVLWSKTNPIGGILPPVGPIAVAPAPLGRVALAACDPPTNIAALRIWDDDGSPFADFQAMRVEGCDSISLLYWPKHGWVIVMPRAGATRAQLLSESGSPKWKDGLDLGARSKAGMVAAASIAADTDDTIVLVQMVQPSAADGSPFHALAFRYDARGTAIWPAAVDLGELPHPPKPGERVKLTLTKPGVRVRLPTGKEIDVRPSGDLVPVQ